MLPSILRVRSCERMRKFWIAASLTSIALLYVLFAIIYDLGFDMWPTRRLTFAIRRSIYMTSSNVTTKKILFWNTMFGDETFYFGKGDIFKYCPGVSRNCWATHDRRLFDVEDFDGILIHGNLDDDLDLPKTRRERQRYIFVNLESPENRPILLNELEYDYFNATMTYRLDSDVVWSYADIREVHNGRIIAPKADVVWSTRLYEATGPQSTGKSYEGSGGMNMSRDKGKTSSTRDKTKTAVWFVSNCNTKSKREKYINELAKHVDVDIFGLCGKSVGCPKDEDCFRKVVEPNYYFYLSFENSMCQDYVTEKLYNVLKYNVVPVVYGGANYSRFAPPKSYINALDFDSPRQLADYLKRLTQEPKEYEKYFEWKKYYKVVESTARVICELCQYLHENNTTSSYSPLSDWYKSGKCPLQENLRALPYLSKQDLKSP